MNYTEYNLYASKDSCQHHVMKVPYSKFNVDNLKPPVVLKRDIPKIVIEKDVISSKKSKVIYEKEEEELHDGWILSDDDDQAFIGKLEAQQSNYVLFVSADNGFKVIPASKWYKFVPKITYKTLSAQEAEERLNEKTKKSNRWMMKEGKGFKDKILAGEFFEKKAVSATKNVEDYDEIAADYEEDFADDEEIVLGIDDEEEAKEAKRRVLGKSANKAFLDDDDFDAEEQKPKKGEREIKKKLSKYEHKSSFELDQDDSDDEEENPYISDVDDNQPPPEDSKEAAEAFVADMLKRSTENVPVPSNPLTPSLKRPQLETSDSSPKRTRTEVSQSSIIGSADVNGGMMPPPPSAAQVLRDLERRQRRASPAPSSPNMTSASPPPVSESDAFAEGQRLLISAMKASVSALSIKDVTLMMKSFANRSAENKSLLKPIMRRVLDIDRASSTVSLKAEFRK